MKNRLQLSKSVETVIVLALLCISSAWSDSTKTLESIRELNRQGNWTEALEQLQDLNQDEPWVALLVIETNWYAGKLAAARTTIKKIPASDASSWLAAQEWLTRIEFLEGKMQACRTVATKLLARDPDNSTALSFLTKCYIRTGDYDEALKLARHYVQLETNPISSRALHAEVLEVTGSVSEAEKVRRSVIPLLNSATNLEAGEYISGSNALRNIREFQAANQCIQLAQDMHKYDPFMKLEKIRLYRATQGYGIAAKTSKELTDFYGSYPLATSEWAEVLWDTRTKEEDVSRLTRFALAGDSTLLDARCRLIFYALLKEDPLEFDSLVAKNLEINPKHSRTLTLQQASLFLKHGEEYRVDTPAFSDLMTDIMTAKNDYTESLNWATAHVEANPKSADALHDLGMAKFRTGAYEESQSILEKALGFDPYAMQTRNLLTYLDGLLDNAVTGDDTVRVVYPKQEVELGKFAHARSQQILAKESLFFNATLNSPLRIQLCSKLDDLAVITDGIPFGCCVDPAHPTATGVVNFEDTMFLWTPKATGRARSHYRVDEALHRGVVQALVRSASNGQAPFWLEEALSGYASWRENPEWAPPNLSSVVAALHNGLELPIAELDEGFLGSRQPAYRVYSILLIEDWVNSNSKIAIEQLISQISEGTPWIVALERTLGRPLNRIDKTSRANILARYSALTQTPGAVTTEARRLLKSGNNAEAAAVMIDAFERNPYDQTTKQLLLDVVAALGATDNKSDAYYHLLEATILLDRSDADMRFELAEWHHENGRKEEAIQYGRSAVGIRPQWLAAHRLLSDIALSQNEYYTAYTSLAVLHAARPKHVKILESLIECVRALGMEDESIRLTNQLKELAPH